MTASDLDLGDWTPTVEDATDLVTSSSAAALHGLLDAPGPPPLPGQPLPPLWHWLAFLPRVPQAELGEDGHPRRGRFLPPIALPRRMFAGGELTFRASLLVAKDLRRTSRVCSVEQKTGTSGPLGFVTVEHVTVDAEQGKGVEEVQTLVFRDSNIGAGGGSPRPLPDLPHANSGDWSWRWDVSINPVLLFRFSALTYNAHRIHYDRPYATKIDGYPGLVVHGPLQAIALAELIRRHVPDRPLTSFRFRNMSPAFDNGPLLLRGAIVDDSHVTLAAFSSDGRATMRATAQLA